jgi:hypothetical protein
MDRQRTNAGEAIAMIPLSKAWRGRNLPAGLMLQTKRLLPVMVVNQTTTHRSSTTMFS